MSSNHKLTSVQKFQFLGILGIPQKLNIKEFETIQKQFKAKKTMVPKII